MKKEYVANVYFIEFLGRDSDQFVLRYHNVFKVRVYEYIFIYRIIYLLTHLVE